MGSDSSVITENKRTCFYEVFEEVCLCCNSEPIEWHVSDYTNINTSDYVTSYSYSDEDEYEDNVNGTIGFTTSSVNLYDFTYGNDERKLGSNWGESTFTYDGTSFTTSKGEQLLNAIQDVGEKIYNEEPEYSFEITPNGMASIRAYNDIYGYEIRYSLLELANEGQCPVYAGPTATYDGGSECVDYSESDDPSSDMTINFQHYYSTFLRDKIGSEITGVEYSGKFSNYSTYGFRTECVISDASDWEAIQSVVGKGCRWVDYSSTASSNGDSNYTINYRLAFK